MSTVVDTERKVNPRPATADLEIEVLNFKPFNRGALRGWVDLIIQPIGLKFNGVAFFQKDGKEWLKLPQREYELNGERRFSPIAEFDSKDAHDRFQRAALEALDGFRRGGGSS